MKDTLTAVRNSLQGINSRVDEAKIQISYLKSEQLKEKRIQNQLGQCKDPLEQLQNTNIFIMGLLEGEEKEQGTEAYFKKMTENVPNLVKEIDV